MVVKGRWGARAGEAGKALVIRRGFSEGGSRSTPPPHPHPISGSRPVAREERETQREREIEREREGPGNIFAEELRPRLDSVVCHMTISPQAQRRQVCFSDEEGRGPCIEQDSKMEQADSEQMGGKGTGACVCVSYVLVCE